MDHLWAPWRLAYVKADKPTPSPALHNDCFICGNLAQSPDHDRANLILWRRTHSVVLLNKFPYNNGHLLVAPLSHKARLDELTSNELLELQLTLCDMIAIIEKTMSPDGFNVGLNLGKVAGAGLPGHLHWHIVPRWNGDTNFMPVISDVKVIVQSLDALYDLLHSTLPTVEPS